MAKIPKSSDYKYIAIALISVTSTICATGLAVLGKEPLIIGMVAGAGVFWSLKVVKTTGSD